MKVKEIFYKINTLENILQAITTHSEELSNIAGVANIDSAYNLLHEYRQVLLDKEVAE